MLRNRNNSGWPLTPEPDRNERRCSQRSWCPTLLYQPASGNQRQPGPRTWRLIVPVRSGLAYKLP